MSNVITFPCKPRCAANDSNPWVSDEPEHPSFVKKVNKVDPVSGVEYVTYVVDEEKPSRTFAFILWVIFWLVLLGLFL